MAWREVVGGSMLMCFLGIFGRAAIEMRASAFWDLARSGIWGMWMFRSRVDFKDQVPMRRFWRKRLFQVYVYFLSFSFSFCSISYFSALMLSEFDLARFCFPLGLPGYHFLLLVFMLVYVVIGDHFISYDL